MNLEHLYLRKTHKYVDSCRDLDKHEYICSVKLTPPQTTEEPQDFDDGGKYVRFGRIPAGASKKDREDILQAARDTFTKWGCHHEYDCCGCRLVSARAQLNGRQLRVETNVSYNY
jgi:hypothetical protein